MLSAATAENDTASRTAQRRTSMRLITLAIQMVFRALRTSSRVIMLNRLPWKPKSTPHCQSLTDFQWSFREQRQTCHAGALTEPLGRASKTGIYSIRIQMRDGARRHASGVLVLLDGRILAGHNRCSGSGDFGSR
jgi:hypothetical protein